MIFSCSLRSQFFIQIFVQKTADFTIFFSSFLKGKKIIKWEKAVGHAHRTGFFFLGLMGNLHSKTPIPSVSVLHCDYKVTGK